MSLLDYHVLLALSSGPLHGYAIREAITADSGGTETPHAGNLYRVIARLITLGWVKEARPGIQSEPHPGLARRYYGLTEAGRATLASEALRLKAAAALAQRRLNTIR